jgi:archaellum component FlaF (FlaF/FlaG flagellin family)
MQGNNTQNLRIVEYNLSTAWDVSSATYSSNSYDLSSYGNYGADFTISPDGTSLYYAHRSDKKVYRFTMSTAWSITTLSYNSSYDFGAEIDSSRYGNCRAVEFTDDGKRMFIVQSTEKIRQYSLLVAWDITTANLDPVSLDLSGLPGISDVGKIRVDPTGTKLVVSGGFSSDWIYFLAGTLLFDYANEIVEDFESATPTIDFVGDWTRTTEDAYEGSYSLKSTNQNQNGTTSTSTATITTTADTVVRLYCKSSSEEGYDFVTVYINGVYVDDFSGISGWQLVESSVLPSGTVTIEVTFEKDGSVAENLDTGYIDLVKVIPVIP